MTFDRLFALARALDLTDLEVKFSNSHACDDPEHSWKAVLRHHFGAESDFGATPSDALAASTARLTEIAARRRLHADGCDLVLAVSLE